ncbi:MAG: S41 family peptidase [Bacteroidia bacterium]|nr:S41 family peptidase [Bacteroidia bacterium]
MIRNIFMHRLGITALALGVAAFLLAAGDADLQRLLRGQELIVTMYRLILSDHVEEIPPDDLLEAATKGMFSAIDPYAEFIEERGSAEMDILNRGSYGGLGIKVLTWNNKHYVSFVYDAVRTLTELRPGDMIVQVDSIRLLNGSARDMRELLRGTPGTPVSIRIVRPGTSDTLTINTMRRSVEVTPLAYAELLDNEIAYVKLARFSRFAADSLRTTLRGMMREKPLKGVILDLRDNPGGLLESAVAVVSLFVPPGQPVVSMRGRDPSKERHYASLPSPIAENIPIAVLVNKRSASASEIVAGAIQDLDRGIVLGNRTFGKGLVQNILQMNYRTSLKLTTAKYYLPSGRCIQRFQYVGGKAVTAEGIDSIGATFRTLKLARTVRQSTGIVPDLSVPDDSLQGPLRCLNTAHAVFFFVSDYLNTHARALPQGEAALQREFSGWLARNDHCLDTELQDQYSALLQHAEQYHVDKAALNALRALEGRLVVDSDLVVRKYWKWLKREIELEFALQSSGERAQIVRALQDDQLAQTARALLRDDKRFHATLKSGPEY